MILTHRFFCPPLFCCLLFSAPAPSPHPLPILFQDQILPSRIQELSRSLPSSFLPEWLGFLLLVLLNTTEEGHSASTHDGFLPYTRTSRLALLVSTSCTCLLFFFFFKSGSQSRWRCSLGMRASSEDQRAGYCLFLPFGEEY